jgi:hypothetical protein
MGSDFGTVARAGALRTGEPLRALLQEGHQLVADQDPEARGVFRAFGAGVHQQLCSRSKAREREQCLQQLTAVRAKPDKHP